MRVRHVYHSAFILTDTIVERADTVKYKQVNTCSCEFNAQLHQHLILTCYEYVPLILETERRCVHVITLRSDETRCCFGKLFIYSLYMQSVNKSSLFYSVWLRSA